MDLLDIPQDGAPNVRAIRQKLELSQEEFARRFGVSVGTLRNWEQGVRLPDGPARVLLKVIEREPEAVKRALAYKPSPRRPKSLNTSAAKRSKSKR
ncbi:DNA-binding protein [alpha proteobacterium U9-1i]|nr:DNA-binding protein [alpha proteobacterium U9-1i]